MSSTLVRYQNSLVTHPSLWPYWLYAIFLTARNQQRRSLLAIAAGGFIFCPWIAYQELFLFKVIYPVCILCQLLMLSIFSLGIILNKRPT